MKKISLDFDDVLYDLHSIMLIQFQKSYNISISKSDVSHWGYFTEYPDIVDIWNNFESYKTADFFRGDIDFVKSLQDRYEVQIVTHSASSIIQGKDNLILERYGDIRVIHTHNGKSVHTTNSILVDDALHNIESHINDNRSPAIIVDRGYGWNQDFNTHSLAKRAQCFKTIEENIFYFLSK